MSPHNRVIAAFIPAGVPAPGTCPEAVPTISAAKLSVAYPLRPDKETFILQN